MVKKIKSLKSQNIGYLTIYVVYCIAVYVVFITGTLEFWNSLTETFAELNSKETLTAIIAPILAIILIGIFTADFKAKLVFLRSKNVLPGHRAFSQLGKKDSRFIITDLERLLGNLPVDPIKQNALWYKLFKKCEHESSVADAHRIFLLTRDLTAISFLFLCLGTLSIIIQHSNILTTLWYAIYMLVHFLVIGLTARHYGNRFVCNVLASSITANDASQDS